MHAYICIYLLTYLHIYLLTYLLTYTHYIHTLTYIIRDQNLQQIPKRQNGPTCKPSVQRVFDCSELRKFTAYGEPWRHQAGCHFGGRLAVAGFESGPHCRQIATDGWKPRGSSSPSASPPSQAASAFTERSTTHKLNLVTSCHQNLVHTQTLTHTHTHTHAHAHTCTHPTPQARDWPSTVWAPATRSKQVATPSPSPPFGNRCGGLYDLAADSEDHALQTKERVIPEVRKGHS